MAVFHTPTPTLAAEINAATRNLHTELNKLIIDRIPLALPPYNTDPSLYLLGLSAFANVYTTFERCWTDILAERHDRIAYSWKRQHKDDILSFLSTLVPPELHRTNRLRDDLSLHSQFKRAGPNPGETRYMAHIERAVRARPHVLIAYAWVMYMAIFSGGRYIRYHLASAGSEFWNPSLEQKQEKDSAAQQQPDTGSMDAPIPSQPQEFRGFSFLNFAPGTNDGEALRNAFKTHLADAEALLTPSERADVVSEAKRIFMYTVDLVLELDDAIGKLACVSGSDVKESGKVDYEEKGYGSLLPSADERSLLLHPPTEVSSVLLRFAQRKIAAKRLAVLLSVLLLIYTLTVSFGT